MELGDAVNQLIRGGVIQDEADGFDGIESGRDRDEFGFGEDDEARISAGVRERGDEIAGFPLGDIGTDRFDRADDIVPGRIWERGNVGVHAATHQNIGEGDTACEYLYADFTADGVADVVVD